FGTGVGVHGDIAVVGAYKYGGRGSGSGAVHIFVRAGAEWSHQRRLVAPGSTALNWFGTNVAIHGDSVVVGKGLDGQIGYTSGAAHIYARNGAISGFTKRSSWRQMELSTTLSALALEWTRAQSSLARATTTKMEATSVALFMSTSETELSGLASWIQMVRLVISLVRVLQFTPAPLLLGPRVANRMCSRPKRDGELRIMNSKDIPNPPPPPRTLAFAKPWAPQAGTWSPLLPLAPVKDVCPSRRSSHRFKPPASQEGIRYPILMTLLAKEAYALHV
ncbi:hypothetical protein ACHAWF_001531, partial [Thalassiosira exigua]